MIIMNWDDILEKPLHQIECKPKEIVDDRLSTEEFKEILKKYDSSTPTMKANTLLLPKEIIESMKSIWKTMQQSPYDE